MDNLNVVNYKIEKECFFKWINWIFRQHKQPLINNISYDLRDGDKLLSLIKILSKNDLSMDNEDSINKKWNKIDRCLDFLNSHDIDTEDIKSSLILNGNLNATLNLLWKIILFWQIKRTCELESLNDQDLRAFILEWCNQKLKKYNLTVSNFGTDWKNGLAFNALLHSLDPDAFDFDEIREIPGRQALAHAFKVAMEKYDIPNILEPMDVDRESPDSKCIFLYTALIYAKALKPQGPLSFYDTTVAEYWSRLEDIIAWLKSSQSALRKDKPISGDIDQVKEEFNSHENFITSLMAQQAEVFATLKEGKNTLQTSGKALDKTHKAALVDRMKELNALWENIRVDTLEYQSRLQNALNSIQKEQMAAFESWLGDMEEMRLTVGSGGTELTADQVQLLKKEFDQGTTLIKPLSNMLVVIDSDEDQDYKAFEEKLASLQNRYVAVSRWAEGLKDVTGSSILVPVIGADDSHVIDDAPRPSDSRRRSRDLEAHFETANELKDWNTDTLSKLETLADYCTNPGRWEEMGEDLSNLPSLQVIKQEYQANETKLKELLQEFHRDSQTQTPDLSLKKQLESVERTMNYVKFKIEKVDSFKSELPLLEQPSPSFKKMKIEPSHSFKGRPLAASPLLSPLDLSGASSPTTIIKPLHEGSTSPPATTFGHSHVSSNLTAAQPPSTAFKFARVPSIEVTSGEPQTEPGTEDSGPEERREPLPSVENILSRKRGSLSVPSEFPELTIPAVESEHPSTVHLSKVPYASHDIERIHVDIYDINEMLKELEAWFMHAKEQPNFTTASQTKEFSNAIENCSTKLDNIKALWPKIEETRNLARQAVSQSGDETYLNLLHDSNNMIHRWEGLFEQTNQYFESLVNMLEAYHYQSFQEPLTSLNRWLDNVQATLIAESNKYNEPSIMQDNLKKLQGIQATIHGQSPNLSSIRNIWEEKMSDENFHYSLRDKFQKDIDQIAQKFDKVSQLGDESVTELEKRLFLMKNYLDEVGVLKSWMSDLNKILESDQSDSNVEISSPKLKQEELKGLQENLDLLRPNLDNVNKVTTKVLENCDIDFAKKIKDDVRSLNDVWRKIIGQSDKEKTWFNFDEYMQYLDRIDKLMDSPLPIETEKDINSQIETLKNLKGDLDQKKATFYNNLPSGLFPEGVIPVKEEEELNSKYNNIAEKLDSLIDFYQTSQQDYLEFKSELSKTNRELDEISFKIDASPKERTTEVIEHITKQLAQSPEAKLKGLPHIINRKLSGLKERAQVLEKNKILPRIIKADMEAITDKVNKLTPTITPNVIDDQLTPVPASVPGSSGHGRADGVALSPYEEDEEEAKARLDANILKLQEWIVHEDMLIMSHVDSGSRDLPPEEYGQMVKDFKEKEALFRSIEENLNRLSDEDKAREMSQQLQVMRTRFQNVQATFEDFEMPPQVVPRLKRIRLSLADIKDDVEELKVNVTKPTDIRQQLDRCLRDCYRLGDVKSTLEQLNSELPDLLKDENSEIRKEIVEKVELLKQRYNDLGDKANEKKAALQTALEIGDKFEKLDAPLKAWIQSTEADLDERRRKVNPSNLSKEINNIKQLEMEIIEKEGDFLDLNALLNEYRSKFTGDEGKVKNYELAAEETRLHLDRLSSKIKEDGAYYQDLESLLDKLKGEVGGVRAFIQKAQQQLSSPEAVEPSDFEALKVEMEGSRKNLTQANSTGSQLVGSNDNFRTTTLSELASLKKQFEDIAHEIEEKSKASPTAKLATAPRGATIESADLTETETEPRVREEKSQGLEQEISFGIARLNDFARQLEPGKDRITTLTVLDPDSEKFESPLDARIQALKSEYTTTQDLMTSLRDKVDKAHPDSNQLVGQDFDRVQDKWGATVKPAADAKIADYETLASHWRNFVSDGKDLSARLTQLAQTQDPDSEKYNNFVGLAAVDLENLRSEAVIFKNTELATLANILITTLGDKFERVSKTSTRSSSLTQYPKTPPPTPSFQSGGASVARLPTTQMAEVYDWTRMSSKFSTASAPAPPPIPEDEMAEGLAATEDRPRAQLGPKNRAKTGSPDRLDYSSDPHEFLWEISNIQEMVDRMLQDLKDPALFGDEPQNIPLRKERLMSIKETLEAISPGIEGSESHKDDIKKYNDDQSVARQIEDSLNHLKTDWVTLNQVYNDKLNTIGTDGRNKSTEPLTTTRANLAQEPTIKRDDVMEQFGEATEVATLPDKFNLVDQEAPEAIELVSRLQDLALWLQKCETDLKKPIPLFNESALRDEKTAYKAEEAMFPSKLKILKESQSTLDKLKGSGTLSPDKVDRIQQLIEQAKDKYSVISKEYGGKRKEIDDQYNRFSHFSQQLDGLGAWLSSTRKNIENSLTSLKEDDVKDIQRKLTERQPAYDQLNYNYLQLANDGTRYNELYDTDAYQVPDGWTEALRQLNSDWDFIRTIDPQNIQKTVASEKLQAAQPNIQAKWPKVQQEMYQMGDKLTTIDNYLASRIVDIINVPEIDGEIMSLKESIKELKNLKGHITQIEKMEDNLLFEQAGYKDNQIKEVQDKCDALITRTKDRLIALNAMRQDALKYDYLYTTFCEWLRVNSPILRELVDCPEHGKITEEELKKNHDYLEQKVPTYSKLSHDIQMLSSMMSRSYLNDDPSNLNHKTSNVYKLWYRIQRGEEIGPKISVSALGRFDPSIVQPQKVSPTQTAGGELRPKDLREFRGQLESFKVALDSETSVLDVLNSEIGQTMKAKDEAYLKVWLEQVREFQRDLEGNHRPTYNTVNENGKKILGDPSLVQSKEEVLALRYKLDDINKKWEHLKTQTNTLRNSLEEHFESQNEHPLTLGIDGALAWVIDRRNHLEGMKPLRGDVNGLRHQLEEVRRFNERAEAKRDPAVQDVLKNGQAYLAEMGYYKALAGELPLAPDKLEEGKALENQLINLQSRWTELLDSGIGWENTIANMLTKVEDLNMNMVDLDLTLKDKREALDSLDKDLRSDDVAVNMPKYRALYDDVQELKGPVYDLNGESANLLAQGLHLSKENDKRLQKLNDDWQNLQEALAQRLSSTRDVATSQTVPPQKNALPTAPPKMAPLSVPKPSTDPAKSGVPSSVQHIYQPKSAVVPYRPSRDTSYVLKDPTLPPMWEKALTENGVPYYINLATEMTYWDHPKMLEITNSLTETNYIKYSAYRTAMKLRTIQKRLFLYLLKLGSAIDLFDSHNLRGKNDGYIRVAQMSSLSKSLYDKLNQDNPDIVTNVPLSSDLYVDWLLDVYDSLRTGKIRVLSMKVATIILCRAHLIDKYKYLIQLVADSNGNVTREKLAMLLKDMLMIPKYLGEVASFGGSDPGPSVASCFEYAARAASSTDSTLPRPRSVSPTSAEPQQHQRATSPEPPRLVGGVGGSLRATNAGSTQGKQDTVRAIDFVTWMNRDPQSVVWLPVLYRLAAAETARHQSKCNICKAYPIVGFRYRCLKCLNFDICQQCFFLGKRYKTHKPSHPLHEYSTPTTTGEDVKDLTKTIKNKLFRSKWYFRTHPRLGYLPLEVRSNQRSVYAYPGDSSEDEENRPLVSGGPPGIDGSYRASASPESTLNYPHGGVIPATAGKGNVKDSYELEGRKVPGRDGGTNELTLANADEHTLINKYCHDLSNNPSPSLSKLSLNTDDDSKVYLDNRIRDLELEHITLKREYERLKHSGYDDPSHDNYDDDRQYSPLHRGDGREADTSINFNGFESMYHTSSPYNEPSHPRMKNVDNLRLDDPSHPYIRLAG